MRNVAKELKHLLDVMKQSDLSEAMIQEASDRFILEAAVDAADEILMEFSDGSVEHIDLLTADVAAKFCDKVLISQRARRSRQQLTQAVNQTKKDGTCDFGQ